MVAVKFGRIFTGFTGGVLTAAVALVICLFIGCDANCQEPVPTPAASVLNQEFFVGATEDDKSFVRAVRKAIDADSSMRPLQKWRLNRMLNRSSFVARAKAECRLEMWSMDPELYSGIIDWENLDIEKLKQLVEVIMQLIQFISDLFASIGMDPETAYGFACEIVGLWLESTVMT